MGLNKFLKSEHAHEAAAQNCERGGEAPGPFAGIEETIAAIRAGKMVIVVDDEDRENEGDLTIAAEKITPEAINFMARHGRGLIGIGVQILRELGVRSTRLLSNNPRKLVAIEGYGLSVTEWLPLEIPASASTVRYLTTKRNKLGHVLRGL